MQELALGRPLQEQLCICKGSQATRIGLCPSSHSTPLSDSSRRVLPQGRAQACWKGKSGAPEWAVPQESRSLEAESKGDLSNLIHFFPTSSSRQLWFMMHGVGRALNGSLCPKRPEHIQALDWKWQVTKHLASHGPLTTFTSPAALTPFCSLRSEHSRWDLS